MTRYRWGREEGREGREGRWGREKDMEGRKGMEEGRDDREEGREEGRVDMAGREVREGSCQSPSCLVPGHTER